jgi:hypothetical protein
MMTRLFSDFLEQERLEEANNPFKTAPGQIQFSESNFDTPYIKDMVIQLADATGETKGNIEYMLMNKIEKMTKNYQGSDILYSEMRKNVGESALFSVMEELSEKLEMDDDLFDPLVYKKLGQYVMAENPQYFPLRNPYESRQVTPQFWLAPKHIPIMHDPALKNAAKKIDTAFCDARANICFNVPFAKRLCLFAKMKGIKTNSKKYMSNGGDIPDHYCYIETVIAHELNHFSAGDLIKQVKDKKLNGTIMNYASDFINNFTLMKSGYAQLPIGLFSDQINLDRFESFKEVYMFIKDEMDKMTTEQQEQAKQTQQEQGDDHEESTEAAEQQEQEESGQSGESQEQQDDSDDSQDDSEQSQSSSGEDSDESDSKSSQSGESGEGSDEPNFDDIDESTKKNDENMQQREDGNTDVEKVLNKRDADKPKTSMDDLRKEMEKAKADAQVNDSGYQAKIGWKKLLKRMIPSNEKSDTSYKKISRSSSSRMLQAKTTGKAAVKPGTVTFEGDDKGLVFVIDNSGSVASVLEKFNKEILRLIEKYGKELDKFFVMKFHNDFELYYVDVKEMKYQKVVNPETVFKRSGKMKERIKTIGTMLPAKQLFQRGLSGGTKFTNSMYSIVYSMHKSGLNVVMFTDDDLAIFNDDESVNNVQSLLALGTKKKGTVSIIITNEIEYETFVKKFGSFPRMITHFDKV